MGLVPPPGSAHAPAPPPQPQAAPAPRSPAARPAPAQSASPRPPVRQMEAAPAFQVPRDPIGCPSMEAVSSASSLQDLESRINGCLACPLGPGRIRFVFGEGNPKARMMFIGEGPGRDEDLQGRPFVGKAGELLDKMIGALGYQREDVYIANVVKCRPPGQPDPDPPGGPGLSALSPEADRTDQPRRHRRPGCHPPPGAAGRDHRHHTDPGSVAAPGRNPGHADLPPCLCSAPIHPGCAASRLDGSSGRQDLAG